MVPLTYDEAASYLRFVSTDIMSVFNFAVATNHFLSTIVTRLAHAVAGDSEFVLRLTGLMGYLLYSGFSFLIVRQLSNRVIALAGFTLFHVNPYVLDYFALSRGYGLSLGLLMGALYFLFRFFQAHPHITTARRELTCSLAFATVSVSANFSLVFVYAAIVLFVLIAGAPGWRRLASNGKSNLEPVPAGPQGSRRWMRLLLPVLGVLFVIAFVSQNVDLSPRVYERVVVRIDGPVGPELDAITVQAFDVRRRSARLTRDGLEWRTPDPRPVTALRIELPHVLREKVASVHVAIGGREFSEEQGKSLFWRTTLLGSAAVLESTPSLSLPRARVAAFQSILNWGGERRYVATVARYAGISLVLLTVLAVVLEIVGRAAIRFGAVCRIVWRRILWSLVAVATFSGLALYVLRVRRELYYGRTNGLVEDTFKSLIDGFFYNQGYYEHQVAVVLLLIFASFGAATVLVFFRHRRDGFRPVLPVVAVGSIMLIVAAAVVVQRTLFDSPYLFGRSALFYIPLYVLFITLVSDATAALGRAFRVLSASGICVVAVLCIGHFAAVANGRYVLDWRDDAATKMMVADVVDLSTRGTATPRHVTLGVEPPYFPVAVFYAARSGVPMIVEVLPSVEPVDYEYRAAANGSPSLRVIARYNVASTLLAEASR